MFKQNNKIDRLHERCLRILSSDKTSDFGELLEKGGCLFTTKISDSLQLKSSQSQKVYVLKL